MRLLQIFSGLVFIFATTLAQAKMDIPWTFQPLPAKPPIPADNPQTNAKIELGKQLFFDTRLSVTGTHSCNTCHNLAAGGEDGRAHPVGVYDRKGRRSTLPIWNAAYFTILNWDGSAKTLEEQTRYHILDPNVMGMPDSQQVADRFGSIEGYRNEFAKVFGKEGLTLDTISKALSSFVRTLVTPNSAFDRFLEGNRKAISEQAKRGFHDYIETGCASCHFWVNLAGPQPGLAMQQGEGFYELFPNHPGTDYEKRYGLADDIGRYDFSHIKTDIRMWRVPSLHNIELTAPYFHNGSVKTLDEAVRVMGKVQEWVDLTDQQVDDIVAFLRTLTGEFPTIEMPRLPATPGRTAVAGHDD
jgi:cytochrome c peroxidase